MRESSPSTIFVASLKREGFSWLTYHSDKMNDELLKDSRFAHIPKDPKFRRIPKHERKIKIDKRFQSMFKDKNFSVKYTIDKRGRPMNHTSSEDLKKYYELSSSSDDGESDDDDDDGENESVTNTEISEQKLPTKKGKSVGKATEKSVKKKKIKSADKAKEAQSEEDLSDNDEDKEGDDEEHSNSKDSDVSDALDIDETNDSENEKQLNIRQENENKSLGKNIKKKLRDLTIDYARGEGVLLSDSSSEEESSEEESEDDGIEHNWGELDREAETTDEITSRLAACNMDWDRIRAVDLMVLFNSFLPPSGMIHSVKIYPSEFGKQRMKDEEVKGPTELADVKAENVDDEDDEEGSQYHMEKMRQYQLNRLKYYYAVITCDCPETANKIYTECDGIEYESTATKFDLRFIPDDMTFDDEPREVCEKLPELSKYQPRQFTTTALQQVKVELTWDETNPERVEIAQKLNSGKIDDIDQNDIKAYLASGSSDDESENGENNGKKDHSDGSEADENDGQDPIEKYRSLLKSIEEKEEEEKKKKIELEYSWDIGAKEKTDKMIKEKMKKIEQMTPFEKYLEKRKEKKKAKKDKKANKDDMNGDDASGSDDSIPSDVDMNDPYFAEEMKNMKKSKKKTKKTEENEQLVNSDDEKQAKAELELLMLDADDEKDKSHFNMKAIENNEMLTKSKKKRLSKKQKMQKESVVDDNFKVDVSDPRFNALFTSHHYNIDPADPHYRNTPGTTALINEQLKRRANKIEEQEVPTKQAKNDKLNSDLVALVKAVKKNTKNNISKRIK